MLEALALETPVIVSDLPSLTELVRDGREGAVFRRGDTDRLAGLLIELAEGPRKWASRLRAGVARLTERHDPGAIGRAYESVYEEALRK